ncbi:Proliferation-associated protein 2G4 [Rhizophlyctis rosea]|nr:Proliferation-associated protein 2G4 [Rhizophlyctis rosea]
MRGKGAAEDFQSIHDGTAKKMAVEYCIGKVDPDVGAKENPITGPKAYVIQAPYTSIEAAIRLLRPGKNTTKGTRTIQKVAEDYNCKPVEGMLSHQLLRNVREGKKQIILISDTEKKEVETHTFKEDKVYSLDILSPQRNPDVNYRLKMKTSRAVLGKINSKRGTMVFELRQLEDEEKGAWTRMLRIHGESKVAFLVFDTLLIFVALAVLLFTSFTWSNRYTETDVIRIFEPALVKCIAILGVFMAVVGVDYIGAFAHKKLATGVDAVLLWPVVLAAIVLDFWEYKTLHSSGLENNSTSSTDLTLTNYAKVTSTPPDNSTTPTLSQISFAISRSSTAITLPISSIFTIIAFPAHISSPSSPPFEQEGAAAKEEAAEGDYATFNMMTT